MSLYIEDFITFKDSLTQQPKAFSGCRIVENCSWPTPGHFYLTLFFFTDPMVARASAS